MPALNSFADVVPFLNAHLHNPSGPFVEALKMVFNQQPDFASMVLSTYARHLSPQDFQNLADSYPALQPLLSGYGQVFASGH